MGDGDPYKPPGGRHAPPPYPDRSHMDIPDSVNVLGVTYRVEIGVCEPDEDGVGVNELTFLAH